MRLLIRVYIFQGTHPHLYVIPPTSPKHTPHTSTHRAQGLGGDGRGAVSRSVGGTVRLSRKESLHTLHTGGRHAHCCGQLYIHGCRRLDSSAPGRLHCSQHTRHSELMILEWVLPPPPCCTCATGANPAISNELKLSSCSREGICDIHIIGRRPCGGYGVRCYVSMPVLYMCNTISLGNIRQSNPPR